ncbi:hypothetical protein BGZ98_003052 [Dissophora globulifera]|nr:hypothetical protein BGZ98_003052 [Dissophora globulifera]
MFDFLIDIVPRDDFKATKESKVAAAAATGGANPSSSVEHRRSQEVFPPLGSVPSADPGSSATHPGPGFEGYGYPYGVLESGSFAMGPGEPLDPYHQQQQQQQELQLQYMRAQQQQHPHQQQQRYDFQPHQQQHPLHDNGIGDVSHPSQRLQPPDGW